VTRSWCEVLLRGRRKDENPLRDLTSDLRPEFVPDCWMDEKRVLRCARQSRNVFVFVFRVDKSTSDGDNGVVNGLAL
jgi:hypothetical protein